MHAKTDGHRRPLSYSYHSSDSTTIGQSSSQSSVSVSVSFGAAEAELTLVHLVPVRTLMPQAWVERLLLTGVEVAQEAPATTLISRPPCMAAL